MNDLPPRVNPRITRSNANLEQKEDINAITENAFHLPRNTPVNSRAPSPMNDSTRTASAQPRSASTQFFIPGTTQSAIASFDVISSSAVPTHVITFTQPVISALGGSTKPSRDLSPFRLNPPQAINNPIKASRSSSDTSAPFSTAFPSHHAITLLDPAEPQPGRSSPSPSQMTESSTPSQATAFHNMLYREQITNMDARISDTTNSYEVLANKQILLAEVINNLSLSTARLEKNFANKIQSDASAPFLKSEKATKRESDQRKADLEFFDNLLAESTSASELRTAASELRHERLLAESIAASELRQRKIAEYMIHTNDQLHQASLQDLELKFDKFSEYTNEQLQFLNDNVASHDLIHKVNQDTNNFQSVQPLRDEFSTLSALVDTKVTIKAFCTVIDDLNLTLHKQHSAISHLQQENQDVHTLVSASLQPRHSPDTSFFSISDHTPSKLPQSSIQARAQLSESISTSTTPFPNLNNHATLHLIEGKSADDNSSPNDPLRAADSRLFSNRSTQPRHASSTNNIFNTDSDLSSPNLFNPSNRTHKNSSKSNSHDLFDLSSDLSLKPVFDISRQSHRQHTVDLNVNTLVLDRLTILEKLLSPTPPMAPPSYTGYDYETHYISYDHLDNNNKNRNASSTQDTALLRFLEFQVDVHPKNHQAMEATADYQAFMTGVSFSSLFISPELVISLKIHYDKLRSHTASNMHACINARYKAFTLIRNNNRPLYKFINDQIPNIINTIIDRTDDPTWKSIDQSLRRVMTNELRTMISINDMFLMTALELGCAVELSWHSHALPFLIRTMYPRTPNMDGVRTFSLFMYSVSELTGALINFPVIAPAALLQCLLNLAVAPFARDSSFRPSIPTSVRLFPKEPFGHCILRLMTRNINLFYVIISAITPARFDNIVSFDAFQDLATLIGTVLDTHINQLIKNRSLLDNTKISTSATQLPECDVLSLFNRSLNRYEIITRHDPLYQPFFSCLDIAFGRDGHFILDKVLKIFNPAQAPIKKSQSTSQPPPPTASQLPPQQNQRSSAPALPNPLSQANSNKPPLNNSVPVSQISSNKQIPNVTTNQMPPSYTSNSLNPNSSNHSLYGSSPDAAIKPAFANNPQQRSVQASQPYVNRPAQAMNPRPPHSPNQPSHQNHYNFNVPRAGPPSISVHALQEEISDNLTHTLDRPPSPLSSPFLDPSSLQVSDYLPESPYSIHDSTSPTPDYSVNYGSITYDLVNSNSDAVDDHAPEDNYSTYERDYSDHQFNTINHNLSVNASENIHGLHAPSFDDYLSSEDAKLDPFLPIHVLGGIASYQNISPHLSVKIIVVGHRALSPRLDSSVILSMDTCCGKDVISPEHPFFKRNPDLLKLEYTVPDVRLKTATGEVIISDKAILLTFTCSRFPLLQDTTLEFVLLPQLEPPTTILVSLNSAYSTGYLSSMFPPSPICQPKVSAQLHQLSMDDDNLLASSSILMLSNIAPNGLDLIQLQAQSIVQKNRDYLALCHFEDYHNIYKPNSYGPLNIHFSLFYTAPSLYRTRSGLAIGNALYCKIDINPGKRFHGFGQGILRSLFECAQLITEGKGRYMVRTSTKSLVADYNDVLQFSLASFANSSYNLVDKSNHSAITNTALKNNSDSAYLQFTKHIPADTQIFLLYGPDMNLVSNEQVFEPSPPTPPSTIPSQSSSHSDFPPPTSKSKTVQSKINQYFTRSCKTPSAAHSFSASSSANVIHIPLHSSAKPFSSPTITPAPSTPSKVSAIFHNTIDLVSPTLSDESFTDSTLILCTTPALRHSSQETIIDSSSDLDSPSASNLHTYDKPYFNNQSFEPRPSYEQSPFTIRPPELNYISTPHHRHFIQPSSSMSTSHYIPLSSTSTCRSPSPVHNLKFKPSPAYKPLPFIHSRVIIDKPPYPLRFNPPAYDVFDYDIKPSNNSDDRHGPFTHLQPNTRVEHNPDTFSQQYHSTKSHDQMLDDISYSQTPFSSFPSRSQLSIPSLRQNLDPPFTSDPTNNSCNTKLDTRDPNIKVRAVDPSTRPKFNSTRPLLDGTILHTIDPNSTEPSIALCLACGETHGSTIHNSICINCFKTSIVGLPANATISPEQLHPFISYMNSPPVPYNYNNTDIRNKRKSMSYPEFKSWFNSMYPSDDIICKHMHLHAESNINFYNSQCDLALSDLHRVHIHITAYMKFCKTLGPEDLTSTPLTASQIFQLSQYDNYQEKPITPENYATIKKFYHLLDRLQYRPCDYPQSRNPQISHFCAHIYKRCKPWRGMFNDILFYSRVERAKAYMEAVHLHVLSITAQLYYDSDYEKLAKIETVMSPQDILDNALVLFLCRRYYAIHRNGIFIEPHPPPIPPAIPIAIAIPIIPIIPSNPYFAALHVPTPEYPNNATDVNDIHVSIQEPSDIHMLPSISEPFYPFTTQLALTDAQYIQSHIDQLLELANVPAPILSDTFHADPHAFIQHLIDATPDLSRKLRLMRLSDDISIANQLYTAHFIIAQPSKPFSLPPPHFRPSLQFFESYVSSPYRSERLLIHNTINRGLCADIILRHITDFLDPYADDTPNILDFLTSFIITPGNLNADRLSAIKYAHFEIQNLDIRYAFFTEYYKDRPFPPPFNTNQYRRRHPHLRVSNTDPTTDATALAFAAQFEQIYDDSWTLADARRENTKNLGNYINQSLSFSQSSPY